MEAKGGTLVKIMSIIMIVAGALNIILSIVLIAGGALVSGLGGGSGFAVAGIISLIVSIIQLIGGIIGAVNARKVEKATTVMTWALIVAVLQLINSILLAVVARSGAGNIIVSVVGGIAVPVIMFVGALQTKKGYSSPMDVAGDVKEFAIHTADKAEDAFENVKEKAEGVVEDVKDKFDGDKNQPGGGQ